MRKIMALLMMVILALSCVSYSETEPVRENTYDHLTVGTLTGMTGRFFTDLFGMNAADNDVKMMVHGYDLVRWKSDAATLLLDPSVVSGVSATENTSGDRTYTIVLQRDLTYSDGTEIKAADYAFSILMSASPEFAALGASTDKLAYIAGYEAYAEGSTDILSGVRIISDYTLSLTVKGTYFPDFYELARLDFKPYPISVIAPGCSIVDTGKGCAIRNTDPEKEDRLYSEELLRETVMGEDGYMSHPSVVSGPYLLTSFDGTTAEFELNEQYKGDSEGMKPSIHVITFTSVNNDNAMQMLENGDIDLIIKAANADLIEQGMELTMKSEYSVDNYPRSGLAFLGFSCERDTVSSPAVRKAIAMCIDRDRLITDQVHNYGISVDGYYGMGQWNYQLVTGTITAPIDETDKDEATVESERVAWQALNLDGLTKYEFNTNVAAELLDKDGWLLNEDGTREKNGVVLDLKLAAASQTLANHVSEALLHNLENVGIRLTIEVVPFDELIEMYYAVGNRDIDMTAMAIDFPASFDPTDTYRPGGSENASGIQDEVLFELAEDMRRTKSGDLLTYCSKWVKFQERWTEVLPAIPLYSNVNFDFYHASLHNYTNTGNAGLSDAITAAYLADPTLVLDQPEETEGETNEGDTIIP